MTSSYVLVLSVHGAYPLSSTVHVLIIGTLKFLLRKSSESFDTEIKKKVRNFQYWAKKLLSYKSKTCTAFTLICPTFFCL